LALEKRAADFYRLNTEDLPEAVKSLFHLIDGVDAGTSGPVSCAAAAQAAAWCEYLAAHARRLYAAVTDAARVAAALLATRLSHGRLRARSPRARCTARSGRG